MLKENVIKLLNEQVNKEFYSAYLYLDMANFYVNKGLDGFANWFKLQAAEERDHAMLFIEYLQNNGVEVVLEAIAKPDVKFNALDSPLHESLAHEKYVTESIHNIYDEAVKAKDYRTMTILDWFIKEQGEEELNAQTLIDKFNAFAKDGSGLYQLNQELSQRQYEAPSLVL